jgi:hypothetical protein
MEPARLSVTGNCITIWFKETEKGDRFSLTFQESHDVKFAKEAVTRHLGLSTVESVTLWAGGKRLPGPFILGRLRLGTSDISVSIDTRHR